MTDDEIRQAFESQFGRPPSDEEVAVFGQRLSRQAAARAVLERWQGSLELTEPAFVSRIFPELRS